MSKKRKKNKVRVLVKGPEVSDQKVLRQLDKDREKVEREIRMINARERGEAYGGMFGDPEGALSSTLALMEMLKSKKRNT